MQNILFTALMGSRMLRDTRRILSTYPTDSNEYRTEVEWATEWINDTDRTRPFSFYNVCTVLGIDPEAERSRLYNFMRRTS
jgi:hypothetical protein